MKKSSLLCALIGAMFFSLACDEDSETIPEGEDTSKKPLEGEDTFSGELSEYGKLSEPLFSLDELMEVSINIDEAEWDALRFDAPGMEHFQTACPAGPRPRSFEWHTATVEVNGQSYEAVAIRKKGLMGSMTSDRPSLKIKFDRDNRPSGIRRMTLNNAMGDATFSHECLSYDLFRAAGIAAPRCGLAKVTVNGEPVGVYTHIEEIKSPMLELNFGAGADRTDLYEITMADFQEDRIVMFEPKGLEDGEKADLSALSAIAKALEAEDNELFSALEALIDLDQFFNYWAMEVITAHGDGYAGNQNNSYVYRDPETGLFVFIPWGTDSTFDPPWDFFGDFTGEARPLPWSLYANGALARRLLAHPEGKARYEETLRRLLETVWDENALKEKVNHIQETVAPHLLGSIKEANITEVATLLQFIDDHKGRILDDLNHGLPQWDRSPPPPLCVEIGHTLIGKMRTRMGTMEASLIETGEGEMVDRIGDEENEISLVRGIIDRYTTPFGYEMVYLQLGAGPVEGMKALVLEIEIPGELFQEGKTIKLDWGEAQTGVGLVDLITEEFTPLGFTMTGELTVEKVDPAPDGEVSLSINAPVGVIQV